jgi:xylulose-5-phosphate/fructose-6-phosphate phosphoketolase
VKTDPLTPELLNKMYAYWRAAKYQSVGQIYLYDNPRLELQLTLTDVKLMLQGHCSTTRGHGDLVVTGESQVKTLL